MASSDVQRKLTAILSADVVGYSHLTNPYHPFNKYFGSTMKSKFKFPCQKKGR